MAGEKGGGIFWASLLPFLLSLPMVLASIAAANLRFWVPENAKRRSVRHKRYGLLSVVYWEAGA
ncbi:hypothetical protein N658DRAFT_495068 [Parathielavia hyrcaniae]|uniref:Uncharacterized protein n=1 Tax=Parathielavia hyrcaniae TaxID=113614 RepID=A0AAN6T3T4_9PEZI|nr:hypothetical protein N658DRAFT_495068 [Parathielavia hyrcaniae]